MTRAVLLDLGNVVLGVDFRLVFDRWAEHGGTDTRHFHERWVLDDAYRAHETGAIEFAEYCDNLRRRFELSLSDAQWRDGWNEIWTDPFATVVDLLPAVAERYALYAFTNTNDTHAECWRSRYPNALAHFQHIFVSSEMGLRKPDTEAFEHVCSAIGHARFPACRRGT